MQFAVGPVGVGDFSTANGFDIPPGVDTLVANFGVPSGSGLALLTVGGTTQLYSINLVTGAGTLIGDFLPLDGITPASGLAILNPPSGADFNVDGRGDILWRQDGSGQVYVWEMNGQQLSGGSAAIAPVITIGTWRASATSTATARATFSGGKTAGGYFWEMNGEIKGGGSQSHAPVTSDWHVERQ